MFAKRMKLILAVAVSFLLQFSLFPFFSFHGIVPDILSVLIVFYAYYVKLPRLLLFAGVLGFLKDLFSAGVFGVETVAACGAAYVVFSFIKKFPQDFLLFRVLTTALYVLLVQLVQLIVLVVVDDLQAPGTVLMSIVVPTLVYTSAVAPIALSIYKKVMKETLRQYTLF